MVLIHEDFASSFDSYLQEPFISLSVYKSPQSPNWTSAPGISKSHCFSVLLPKLPKMFVDNNRVRPRAQVLLQTETLSKHHFKLLILHGTH